MATNTEDPPTHRRDGVLEHLEGCPADRPESFRTRRPSTGELLSVDRCIACGGQLVTVIGQGPATSAEAS